MALKIRKERIVQDPALDRSDPKARGDRKVLVTEIWPQAERAIEEAEWQPPAKGGRASVLQVDGLEFAFFTNSAAQTRHRHQAAHEIYTVLEGRCVIEVAGERHQLDTGDSLVVLPGECHEVLKSSAPFLAQVVVTPAGGIDDKFACRPVAE